MDQEDLTQAHSGGSLARGRGEGPVRRVPLHFSVSAQARRWRSLTLSAPETIEAGILTRSLRDKVYDGVSVWWLFGKPILYILAGIILLSSHSGHGPRSAGAPARPEEERRHGRRTKGPELSRALSSPRSGIRLQLERVKRHSATIASASHGSDREPKVRKSARPRLPRPESNGKHYGQDAEAMLFQPATKISFKTSEPRAAKWIEAPMTWTHLRPANQA